MMRKRQLGSIGAALFATAILTLSPVHAQAPAGNATAEVERQAKAPAPQEPAIDPQADRLLREAGDYLKAARQLSFHAAITFDDLLPTGQKIELAAEYDAAVRRPDRVYTEYWGDAGSRRLWYDGRTVTLYDPVLVRIKALLRHLRYQTFRVAPCLPQNPR